MTGIKVRRACPNDWGAIQALSQRACCRLPHLWWWEEHLTDDLFVVVERAGVVLGALFAWPDDSPVAWVRLAALDNTLDVEQWLDLTLCSILERLRHREVRKLAWMDYGGWAGPHLGAHGFKRLAEVRTLVKFDRVLPAVRGVDVHLRPASDADVPAVVAVDRAALAAHWWYSETTLRRRAAVSSYFAVAEVEGAVVGYAEGVLPLTTAHINRIAVHPAHQGQTVVLSGCTVVLDLSLPERS